MFEGSTAKDTFEAKSKPEVEKTIGYAQTKTIYVQGQTFSNNLELSRHFSFVKVKKKLISIKALRSDM